MRTDDFVELLAAAEGAVSSQVPARRYAAALVFGMLGALAAMLAFLGFNASLSSDAQSPMFWVKVGFPLLLAAAGLLAAARLSRPGARLTVLPAALAAPLMALWILAAVTLADAEAGQRLGLVLGHTWRVCPWNIALLSLPAFVAVLWAMKGLAPTRLRLAGAAAGLLGGCLGALAYALHCPELAAPFLGVWYVLGMLIPAAIGVLIGPRVLAW